MLVYDIFYLLSSIDSGFSTRWALHNAAIRLYACSALSKCIILDLRTHKLNKFVMPKKKSQVYLEERQAEMMDKKTACGID